MEWGFLRKALPAGVQQGDPLEFELSTGAPFED